MSPAAPPPKQWWKRAAAALKDRNALVFAHASLLRSSVIRATSHDESPIDRRSLANVISSIRSSPSTLLPVTMRSIARRARRTRSWAVALKSLMLTHSILLCSPDVPAVSAIGRLPFDLSCFRGRGSSSVFAAFVRSYFEFLDDKSVFLCSETECSVWETECPVSEGGDGEMHRLRRVERLQGLLELLLQVRPYGDGIEVELVVEAMGGVVAEVFRVYAEICDGIAGSLVGIFGGARCGGKGRESGEVGVWVLRRAVEQSSRLAAFFEVCKGMGAVEAGEVPSVESVPEEDVDELERMVTGMEEAEADHGSDRRTEVVVVTGEWVVFDDDEQERKGWRLVV